MAFLSTPNLTVYYEQAGSGEPLLVLGGSGADLRKKPNIMQSPLSSHFQLTSYDQRGLGQTEIPDDGYTMAAYADDAAALMDGLNIERAHVLGISFGGMVAQHLALRHGDRIKSLAMFCTAAGGEGGASFPLHKLRELDPQTALTTYMKVADTRVTDAFIADNPDVVATTVARADHSQYAEEPNHEWGRQQQLEARKYHDCWDGLADISCPVWLAGGHYDGIATPEAMQNMASRLPDAELTFYEGGHLFMLEDGRVFPDLINFFKSQS